MPTVEQNHVAELTIHSECARDADGHSYCAYVRPPGSRRARKVPAFWAGPWTWKVRYASPIVGHHKVGIGSSDEWERIPQGEHDIEVVPYTGDNPLYRHGPVAVSRNRRHFVHADGTPFFWLGDTWWMGLCHRMGWPDDFQTLAADRLAKGFSVIQIVAGLYPDMPPFDGRGANEAGFPWEPDYARIRPEYFDLADRRLEYLIEAGLLPCLVGAWGYFIPWMGVDKLKQHWSYLLARYAAYPIVWCIAGEANLPWYLAPGFPYDDREQVHGWSEVARHVRETDPFQRPRSIHPTGLGRLSARGAIDYPGLIDFDMLQTGHGHRDSLAPTIDTLQWSYRQKPTMPVLNSEVAYEELIPQNTAAVQRLYFWTSLLSGACGHTYGANGIWQCNRRDSPHGPSPHGGDYGHIPWDEAMHLPGSTQLGLAKRLLEQYPWERFEPHPEWASFAAADIVDRPYAAGIADTVRVVYLPSRQPVTLHGLAGEWRADRFDPVTGARTVLGPARGGVAIQPPEDADPDWVLLLEAE
ncbi:MAG: DUF4038 domain-containing protein [Armatimonadetes bacterium]|nr:DUF4038 domain-containing protein [Armatimonadota bacterium]